MPEDGRPRGFVFFQQDYFGDVPVRLLPLAERMVWVECFLLMSESPRRGYLLNHSGDPFTPEELQTVINGNSTAAFIQEAIELFKAKKICGWDAALQTIFCRRIVRDEIKRQECARAGKKGWDASPLNPRNKKPEQQTLWHPPGAKTETKTKVNTASSIELACQTPEITPETLFSTWNENRGALPEALALTPERKIKCRARIKTGKPDTQVFLDTWTTSIRRAAVLPFMTGNGNQGWSADFDWFIANNTNYLKVLEGKYDRTAGKPESGAEGRDRRSREKLARFVRGHS